MSKLRLAIIGGGHLGRVHAKLAHTNPQFTVVAVADPSPEMRSLVQTQLGLLTVQEYSELLGKIDAAIVATPTMYHYEITSALLRSGVHCLVEKPLASSADQAQRLVQIARNHRRVLQTGHVERFNPKWTTAIPHLGKPKFIEAVRCGTYSGRSTDIGVVMDLMIHDLDLILSLDHSPVERIDASGLALLGSHEDLAEARLTFASGLVANLRASRLAASGQRRMQLYTTTCYADIDFSADQLRLIRPAEDVQQRLVALDEMPPSERMLAKDQIFQHYLTVETLAAPGRNAILDEQNDFALSIQSRSAPAVSGEDGARAVELAGRIVKAIESRQWDGASSRSWQTGAHAMLQPRVIPLRPNQTDHQADSTRRAG
jgi:predicted dehydrogenase